MIKVLLTPNLRDFRMLNRRTLMNLPTRVLIVFAIGLTVVYLSGPWSILSGQESSVWEIYRKSWMIMILPALILTVFATNRLSASARWRMLSGLRVPREFAFEEEGVRIQGEGVAAFVPWQRFACAEYSRGWFLLHLQKNPLDPFLYFPLEAVGDTRGLISILEEKIRKTKGMKKVPNQSLQTTRLPPDGLGKST